MSKKIKKKLPPLIRTSISLLLIFLFFIFSEQETVGSIAIDEPASLFCNTCNDNLKKTFLKAIYEAKSSINLYIYTLKDREIIEALNKRADEGISVKILHDPVTLASVFSPKITAFSSTGRGLMHLKILIIDEEKIWIGTANFTKESLKMHDNLVVAFSSPSFAYHLLYPNNLKNWNFGCAQARELSLQPKSNSSSCLGINDAPYHHFSCQDQLMEFWMFPKDGKEGLNRLIELLDQSKLSIKIAMFTWTHLSLTQAVIRAKKRGVQVEILMDKGQALGVNAKALAILKKEKISVRLSQGKELLHHKFAWIDDSILATGSANWTKSAFIKNQDCLIILQNLNEEQKSKMKMIWKKSFERTRNLTDKKHLHVFWQRPDFIRNNPFKSVCMAA